MHGAKRLLHLVLTMASILNNRRSTLKDWAPLKLVQFARAGALLIASEFLWVVLHGIVLRFHAYYFGPRLGLVALSVSICFLLAPVSIGAFMIGLTWWRLSDGLTRIRWSEPEIGAARVWAESLDLSRTATQLLWILVVGDIAVSYLVFHVCKAPHHKETKVFFDSLALLCLPFLVVSTTRDKLREEAVDHS